MQEGLFKAKEIRVYFSSTFQADFIFKDLYLMLQNE